MVEKGCPVCGGIDGPCEGDCPSDVQEVIDFFIEHPSHKYKIDDLNAYFERDTFVDVELLIKDGSIVRKDQAYSIKWSMVLKRLLIRMSRAIAEGVTKKHGDPGDGTMECPSCHKITLTSCDDPDCTNLHCKNCCQTVELQPDGTYEKEYTRIRFICDVADACENGHIEEDEAIYLMDPSWYPEISKLPEKRSTDALDEKWYMEQISKVDAYIQIGIVPKEISDAYHHGVRGWICLLVAKLSLKGKDTSLPTEEDPEEKDPCEGCDFEDVGGPCNDCCHNYGSEFKNEDSHEDIEQEVDE